MGASISQNGLLRILMKQAEEEKRKKDAVPGLLQTLVGVGLAGSAGLLLGKVLGRGLGRGIRRIAGATSDALEGGGIDTKLRGLLSDKVMRLQRAFNDNVVVPTSNEFRHTLGGRFTRGFTDRLHYVLRNLPKGNPMQALSNRGRISIDAAQAATPRLGSHLAHEIAHAQYMSTAGLTSAGRKILDMAYGFSPDRIKRTYESLGTKLTDAAARETAIAEQIAVNRGIRFDIFKSLADKLGRTPSYSEFKDYISKATDSDLLTHVMAHAGLHDNTFIRNSGVFRGFLDRMKRSVSDLKEMPGVGYLNTAIRDWVDAFKKRTGRMPLRKEVEDEFRRRNIRRALLEVAKRMAAPSGRMVG